MTEINFHVSISGRLACVNKCSCHFCCVSDLSSIYMNEGFRTEINECVALGCFLFRNLHTNKLQSDSMDYSSV